MRDILPLFLPSGRTSRGHFWIIILTFALLSLVAVSVRDVLGTAAVIALGVVAELIVFIATIRRLHDAGRSRWWTVLFFFPMSITVDLLRVHVGAGTWDFLNIFPVHLGEVYWNFLDVSAVIRLIPVFIGLLASSRSTFGQAMLQVDTLAM